MLKLLKKFHSINLFKKIMTKCQFDTLEEYWTFRYYQLNNEIKSNPHNCQEKINERDGIKLALFGV